MERVTHPSNRSYRALSARFAVVAMCAALGACASQPEKGEKEAAAAVVPTQPRVACVVMPTDAILAWERSRQGVSMFNRFEFSRNDERVNAGDRVPIDATRQWPAPARPREERVEFWYWRQ